MNNSPVVVSIGELLWDVFPDRRTLGGAPANFAYHAKAFGLDTRLVSAVGDDKLGREAISILRAKGVNVDCVSVVKDASTGVVNVSLASDGKPSYEILADAAWDCIKFNSSLERLAVKADAVCFGSLAQRGVCFRKCLKAFLKAMKPGALRVFDINLRSGFIEREPILRSLAKCDVLKLNDEELPYAASILNLKEAGENEMLRDIVNRLNLKAIALTKGAAGCLIATQNGCVAEAAQKSDAVVDTVGAGDAFTACLTAGLLRGMPLKEIAVRANMVAGYVCSQYGATPKLPTSMAELSQ